MFFGVVNVSAQTETNVLLKKHTFDIGPEISYRTYKEPDVMKEKGIMYGLVGSYTYHSKMMLKADGRGSVGWVDYSNSRKIDAIRDYLLEVRGSGGYDFSISNSCITPFIGIGYRYLNDDSPREVSSTGALGYERESAYLYSPTGISYIAGLFQERFKTVDFKAEPFIRYWNIKKSETETWTYYGTPIGHVWEPKTSCSRGFDREWET